MSIGSCQIKYTYPVPTQFSEWLERQFSEHPEWNNKALGAKVGVTGQSVGTWRSGASLPEPPQLLKLAEVAEERPAYLFHITYGMPLYEGEGARDELLTALREEMGALSDDDQRAVLAQIRAFRHARRPK